MDRVTGALRVLAIAIACVPQAAMAAEMPAFDPAVHAAHRASVHVVGDHARLQPQIAYGYTDVGIPYTEYMPDLSFGQNVGVGVAGGLIASAIINGAEYANAKAAVRRPFATLRTAGCDLPVDALLTDRLEAAVQAAWAGAPVVRHTGIKPKAADKAAARTGTRTVLHATATFTPDFGALVVHVEANGYADGRKPVWRDHLIAVSDMLAVPDQKAQSHIDRLVAAEEARFAALGLGPEIARLNRLGANAPRLERQPVEQALAEHRAVMKIARDSAWTPAARAQWRALEWSADGCARTLAALDTASADAARLLGTLLAGGLEAEAVELKGHDVVPNDRRIYRAKPGTYVLQRAADTPLLNFVGTMLDD